MKAKIKVDSKLMENQKQAQVMQAGKTFQALQTAEGHALFFSVGSDDVLHLTRQVPGDVAGWVETNLSASIGKFAVKTFVVSQNLTTNLIDIVVAVKGAGEDEIYTALDIENTDESWTRPIPFVKRPYDNNNMSVPKLVIAGLYTAQTSGSNYTMVDIIEDPQSANQFTYRFMLDPKKKSGNDYVWVRNPLAGNVSASSPIKCSVGRKSGQKIDGVYTLGAIDNSPQLLYTPVYNVGSKYISPAPTRLTMPDGARALAVSLIEKNLTNLYVAAKGRLYFFKSVQNDSDSGVPILENSLFNDVAGLHINTDDNYVYVWGLNDRGQIFYTRCPRGQETNTGAWSLPVPIMRNVTQIATYLNKSHSGNVIFAYTSGSELIELTQDPITTLWNKRKIVLPATDINAVLHFKTFTSHVNVSDENNKAVANVNVAISSVSPISVYINNKFEILSPDTPVDVKTDATGVITIIQETDTISAVCYKLKADSSPDIVDVNPMTAMIEKMSEVNTGNGLRDVVVTNADGSSKPLLPADVSAESADNSTELVKNFVAMSKQLPQDGSRDAARVHLKAALMNEGPFTANRGNIWGASFHNDGEVRYYEGQNAMLHFGLAPHPVTLKFDLHNPDCHLGTGNFLTSAAGDIFNWLKDAFNAVTDFVVSGYNALVKIAGQIYTFVLDCVETVVSAVEFVFNKIKVFIEDLIKWIGFLFQWKDILVTQRVTKNIYIQEIKHAIEMLGDTKKDMKSVLDDLQKTINTWAIPPIAKTPDDTSADAGRAKGMDSAEANYGMYQLKSNTDGIHSPTTMLATADTVPERLLKALMDLLEGEYETFKTAYNRIKTEIIDQFGSISVGEVMKRFIAIVATTLIQAAAHILNAAIDIIAALADGILWLIQQPLEIPVLSWLYKEIADEELTFLSLVCLVSAIPSTILYKAVFNKAPYPRDTPLTNKLISAQSTKELQQAFMADKEYVKSYTIISGYHGAFGSILMTVCAVLRDAYDAVDADVPQWIKQLNSTAVFAYIAPKRATLLLRTDNPNPFEKLEYMLTDLYMLKATTFDNPKLGTKTYKASQWFDFGAHLLWNVPVIANIVNKHGKPDTNDGVLITESVANFCFNLSGIMSPVPSLVANPEAKVIALGVKYGFGIGYGVMSPVVGHLKAGDIK